MKRSLLRLEIRCALVASGLFLVGCGAVTEPPPDGMSSQPPDSDDEAGEASSGDDDDDDDDGDDDDDNNDDDDDDDDECAEHEPRAPLRRLTRFEYSNTLLTLLGDDTKPGNALPSEQVGNGFGNDADAMSTSTLLIEQYANVAEAVATRAVADPGVMDTIAPCAADVTAATELECAREFIADFIPKAYRRPLEADEHDEWLTLFEALRDNSASFSIALAAVVEAVLQTPDFLYRLEWGVDDGQRRRPSGPEMATRLSYLFWGTMPDEKLRQAAAAGELTTDSGIEKHARRLLDDPRTRPIVRYFFDNFLPISSLAQLERDPERYPTFNPAVGAAMREEVQQLLQYEVFEGSGTWAGALTAPYTFVNDRLAEFYGIDGTFDSSFERVDQDADKRAGILTQAGLMAGTTHANETSPVVRGSYVVQKLMCQEIPLPPDDILDMVEPPDPSSGATARERYSEHSENPVCAACHYKMDPTGFALENFDAVGLWRDRENGVLIDTTVEISGLEGEIHGPVELAHKLAAAAPVNNCFARNWGNYGYGLTMGEDDVCTRTELEQAFEAAGGDVKALLLALTSTDAFRYLPSKEQ